MTNPDDPRNWLLKAGGDLLCIDNNLKAEHVPWEAVCFHARQAAEKAFKACLIWKNVDPPRTHDLPKLLELMRCAGVDFSTMREACLTLSDYAVDARYPSDGPEISEREGRWGAEKAREIVAAARAILGAAETGDGPPASAAE